MMSQMVQSDSPARSDIGLTGCRRAPAKPADLAMRLPERGRGLAGPRWAFEVPLRLTRAGLAVGRDAMKPARDAKPSKLNLAGLAREEWFLVISVATSAVFL